MNTLFLGKRFYTNRDALTERFGRLYQLPWHWAQAGIPTTLWLIDYHTTDTVRLSDDALEVISTPARKPGWIAQWLRVMARMFSNSRPRTIVASGDCYIGLLGFQLARALRAQFIFDVYDKYDEFLSFRRPAGFDLFRFLLRHADQRMFASRTLLHSHGSEDHGDVLIPNGIDINRFHSLDKSASRRAHGLPQDACLVGYFGSMEPERGVRDLIDAMQLLRDEGSKIELLIGGRPHPDVDLSAPGVRYVGNVPFDHIPEMLACCDILAAPYRRSPFLDNASSCKIAEYASARRPLVLTRSPGLTNNFGPWIAPLEEFLATPGDTHDLARVIRLQLERKTIIALPETFHWSSIADQAARALRLQPLLTTPQDR